MSDPIVITGVGQLITELHNRRIDNGQTLLGLANRADVTEARVGEWLRGTREPRVSSLLRLLPALGYDLALIRREEP